MSANPAVRMDRAQRAEAVLKELDPIFDAVIKRYMLEQREIARTEPWAAQKMTNLAVAANIADEVRNTMKAIVADGEIAHDQMKRSQTIQKMSPEQRRYADALG